LAISYCYLDIKKKFSHNEESTRLIKRLLKEENRRLGEVSVIFTSNSRILQINRQFLKHNYYTDVITFTNNIRDVVAGDVIISIDQVFVNARFYKIDRLQELFRVIIHGVLHLVGYDDQNAKSRIIMKKREQYYLDTLSESIFLEFDEISL
jgi:rRNA maturation RNase YbeY